MLGAAGLNGYEGTGSLVSGCMQFAGPNGYGMMLGAAGLNGNEDAGSTLGG